jgi:DNA-directed RNA polymerase subunit RPC12/RpoP
MASPHYQTYLKQKGLTKALTASYGGADAPASRTGGSVLQTEAMDSGQTFRYIDCPSCGKDQPYLKYQVKCRNCGKGFPFDTLAKFFISK